MDNWDIDYLKKLWDTRLGKDSKFRQSLLENLQNPNNNNQLTPWATDTYASDIKDPRQLEDQRNNLYGMSINAPTVGEPTRLTNQSYKAGKNATGIRRQSPTTMTNRNAKGTWNRGSQFFQDSSKY